MTFRSTSSFTNSLNQRVCRTWLLPAAAISLLAGTSGALAQDGSGFGLNDALDEQALQDSAYPQLDPVAQGEGSVDLEDLEGAVDVNEYDLVDLHVNNEDLGNILQLLSIQSQRNIISSKEVSATITADLYGVTFYEALDSILNVNGYGYIEQGNFIYVYTREQIEEIVRASRVRVTRVVDLDYLNSNDAAEFARQLLTEGGAITTTAVTESFNIADSVPTGADNYANSATIVINDYEENADAIVELISQLDTKPAQVLVEATILQTSLTEANAFGVDFALIKNLNFSDFVGAGGPLNVVNSLIGGSGQTVGGTDVDVNSSNGVAANSTAGNTATGPATFKAGIVNGDVAVFVRTLDEITDVTVVSNPKILTLNRQPARVLVGTRVGYLNTTTTETSTTQTVEFLDVGTQLAVRPFVSKNGLIRLELRPQVSSFSLRQVTDNTGSAVTIPDEDTTEMTTNVMVRDGQTVVLGGLFTETTTASRRQVPLLGDIPIIGSAFKGNDDEVRRSEIIFLITPSIVNDTSLAMAGEKGTEYIEHARFGARKSLLPWSRERRVGQLLIEARNLADEGKSELALAKIDRALRLSPMSPDARKMRTEISGVMKNMPSRSMLEDICSTETDSGSMATGTIHDLVESATEQEFAAVEEVGFATEEPTPETEVEQLEAETFAEVPVESLSEAETEWSHDWEPASEQQADEAFDAEYAQWEQGEVDSFESQPEVPFVDNTVAEVSTESLGYEEVELDWSTDVPAFSAEETAVVDAAEFVEVAEPVEIAEYAEVSAEYVEDSDGVEVYETMVPEKLAGVLIIPLPGGGSLQLDWPMSISDWAMPVFTSVPTDSVLIDEIAD